MKKYLVLYVGVFVLFALGAPILAYQDIAPEKRVSIRQEFKKAVTSAKKTRELIDSIQNDFSKDPQKYPAIVLAYYGALKGLQAKFAFNPAQKWFYLQECIKRIDEAVSKSPDDVEVRFVRFSTLHHLPPVGEIPERRSEDIALICELLSMPNQGIEKDIYHEMLEFMLKSKRLNTQQFDTLKALDQQSLKK